MNKIQQFYSTLNETSNIQIQVDMHTYASQENFWMSHDLLIITWVLTSCHLNNQLPLNCIKNNVCLIYYTYGNIDIMNMFLEDRTAVTYHIETFVDTVNCLCNYKNSKSSDWNVCLYACDLAVEVQVQSLGYIAWRLESPEILLCMFIVGWG